MAIPKVTPITLPLEDYEYKFCKFKVDGPIATFMWSDPPTRNAFTNKTWEGYHNAVARVREDDDIRVLVITGDPEGKTFCGGLNVKAITEEARTGEKYQGSVKHFFEQEYTPGSIEYQANERNIGIYAFHPEMGAHPALPGYPTSGKGRAYDIYNEWRHQTRFGGSFLERRGEALLELDKPVIAMVNGGAYGFGCDIAFYCDIIIAGEEKGKFEWSYIQRGMVPDEGATYFLSRLCGKHRALELMWTGSPISARQAYEWGLINHVVPDAELESFTYDLARKLATESPPMIMGAIKWCVQKGFNDYNHGLSDHLDMVKALANLTFVGSEDAAEGPRAWSEKRKPVYKFR